MKRARGFTLVELLVAVAILSVALAIAGRLVVEGVRLARGAEETAGSNDAARLALEAIAREARLAGMGAGGGLWVNRGGVPGRVNALQGGTRAGGGPDELWLVVPHVNALKQSCKDRGAAATVVARGPGPLRVTCTSSFDPGDLLLVTNLSSGALLSGLSFAAPGGVATIDYSESAITGFSDAPEQGGFQVGDLAVPVSVAHYYLAPAASTGRLALYRAQGRLQPSASGPPFVDVPGSATLVMHDVEDLQVAFGVDPSLSANPDNIMFQDALGPDYVAGVRSVRLSLVAVSKRRMLDGEDKVVSTAVYAPMAVEDHVPPATSDGFRRSLYSRRVELLNLDPVNL